MRALFFYLYENSRGTGDVAKDSATAIEDLYRHDVFTCYFYVLIHE